MSKLIRIGTRDSQLALWQAKTVQQQLEALGHKTVLVPVKSTGDLVLNKPLYELGITGIFTKTLDIALLNNSIDIAVHSLKDVPTVLPKGIIQAAVLKRGNVRDTLVYKNNEEFLAQKEAVIATGSLRRKAQWLNRYPTHTLVDLRGNVNSRLQKLEDNQWNGAVFAAAGLGRIELRPEEAVNLDWMIPAPAQGAIMMATRESDEDIITICSALNHEETEICTTIERQFLRLLEGGCSAPIGALAFIKNEEVSFQGVLLSLDGTKKIEVVRKEKLGNHHNIAEFSANYVIEHGGKRLMDDIKFIGKQPHIFSTKTFTEAQRHLFKDSITTKSADFVKINLNRIPKHILKTKIKNVIISCPNAVEAILTSCAAEELQFGAIYCIGRRTKRLVERRIGKVTHTENDAKALAKYLTKHSDIAEATYFSGSQNEDILQEIFKEKNMELTHIEAFKTELTPVKIEDAVEGIMFFSPTTVISYLQENTSDKIAYCIGDSTAQEAIKHFSEIRIARIPTVESLIDLVNDHYSQSIS
jgi:hydroxymethylbilane synthase